MKLIYTATARIPSEKAHPYQIVQMCEAFARAGVAVTLIYTRRRNRPPLDTGDIWGVYGVGRTFEARALAVGRPGVGERLEGEVAAAAGVDSFRDGPAYGWSAIQASIFITTIFLRRRPWSSRLSTLGRVLVVMNSVRAHISSADQSIR